MAGRLEGKVAIITGAGCVGPGWGNGRAAAVLPFRFMLGYPVEILVGLSNGEAGGV